MTRIGDWVDDHLGWVIAIGLASLVTFFIVMVILYPCEGNCSSSSDTYSRAPIIIPRPPIGSMPGGITVIP